MVSEATYERANNNCTECHANSERFIKDELAEREIAPRLNFRMHEFHPAFPNLLEFIANKACRCVQRPLEDGDHHLKIKRKTVERIKEMSPYGISHIYAAICVHRFFRNERPNNFGMVEVISCRALWCQRLGRALAREYGERDKVGLFTQALTMRFPRYEWRDGIHVDKLTNTYESALEAAVDSHAIQFLHEAFVQECIQNIWYGNISVSHVKSDIAKKIISKQTADKIEIEVNSRVIMLRNIGSESVWTRLQAPLYQYMFSTILHEVVIITLFSFVAFKRTYSLSVLEFFLWFTVAAETVDEIKKLRQFRIRFYFKSLWSWIDMSTLFFMLVVFALRIATWIRQNFITQEDMLSYGTDDYVPDSPGSESFADNAYNWMAFASIFLWLRLLDILSSYPFFGNALVIIKQMLHDSFLFLFLLATVFLGFMQSFEILNRFSFSETLYMLLRTLLGGPSFEEAQAYHPTLGGPLMMLFVFFSVVLMLNLLIAVFNDSYSRVVASTSFEFLWHFTWRTVVYMETPQTLPFLLPFNLLNVVIISPIAYVLGYHDLGYKFKYFAWQLCSVHGVVATYIYEFFKGRPKSIVETNYDSIADLKGFGNPHSLDYQMFVHCLKAINVCGVETDTHKLVVANSLIESCFKDGAVVHSDKTNVKIKLDPTNVIGAGPPRADAMPNRERRQLKNRKKQLEEFEAFEPEEDVFEAWDSDSDEDPLLSDIETITSGDGLGKQTIDRLEQMEKVLKRIQYSIETLQEQQNAFATTINAENMLPS